MDPVTTAAADPAMTATLQPIIETFVNLFLAALLPAVAVLLKKGMDWLSAKTHLDLKNYEQIVVDRVDSAITRGAHLAVQKLKDGNMTTVRTKSEAVMTAIAFANKAVPDALAGLGVTPEHLESMVRARLHDLLPEDPGSNDLNHDGIADSEQDPALVAAGVAALEQARKAVQNGAAG